MNYLINGITFNTQLRTLSLAGKQVYLEAKSFELLSIFVLNPNCVLTRDELLSLAWQGKVVSDSAINKAISKLRQHFDTLQPEAQIIQTKPKVGYLFCATVITQQTVKYQPRVHLASTVLYLLLCLSVIAAMFWLSKQKFAESTPLQLQRITAHEGIETQLSAAKNGQIAYLSTRYDSNTRQVYLKNLATNQTQRLPIEVDGLHAFNVNFAGQKIAYVMQQEESCMLALYDLSTHSSSDIMDCQGMNNIKLAWQFDDQALFIRSRKNNAHPYTIFKFLIHSQTLSQVSLPTENLDMQGDYLLAAHPNTHTLAFVRYLESNQTQIHIVDSHTLNPIHTVPFAGVIKAISWDVDGDQLFFNAQKTLYKLHTDTLQIKKLKDLSHPIESIAVTKVNDFTMLLLSQYHASSKIIELNLENKQRHTLFDNAALNRLPQKTQEGDLIFISDAEQQHDLWVLQNGRATKLALPFEFGFRRFELHPTEKKLLFEKEGALIELSLDSQIVKQVFAAKHKAYVANYHDGGNKIIYSSNKRGDWQLWLFDRRTKQHLQLTHAGGYSGFYYQDQLYFTKRHVSGVWTLNAGQEQLVLPNVKNINWLNWRIIAGRIYFYQPEEGIFQYDLDTGQTLRLLSQPSGFLHQYSIRTSPETITYVELKPMQGDIHALTL
ncbi:winged helix-turn-helix domain-containing protein [Pseudoalteromonas obscura]|uniref:Winged helix-turn-helix domain-containing protein n=1 Tax=Pseudoalteromonas obscura TaxID=3048491 RepID=A0ABT7EQZ5_9GAMM|nr:winged helix-turn-helix domain-containing protein [Pseudoalteromonas sp. P94(2023)]MDK2597472.1 winged helix-turn-helix domain-containing protein [Pseudoalteromonas sp. P94(2023)]